MKYPVYTSEITSREKELVMDCLDTSWISSRGTYIERFERMVAEYLGCDEAVAVMNGTVALHLAVIAAGVGPGDEVIMPDLTYVASANSVRYAGGVPVLADVDPGSWNVTAETIEPLVTSRTKAIMTVDIYGTPPDMEPIRELARRKGLAIVEDAAESIGASYRGEMAGTLGDIGIISFFGNKTVTTGEGGMVVLKDRDVAARLRKLRSQGNSETRRYFHDILGYNYRMTNIQAAIGCAQMERIDSIVDRKRRIQERYRRALEGILTFQTSGEGIESTYWMVSMLARDCAQRDRLRQALEDEGIETRPFFLPVHAMPFYEDVGNPVAESLSSRGLNVPSYHRLSDGDVDYISGKIRGIIETGEN